MNTILFGYKKNFIHFIEIHFIHNSQENFVPNVIHKNKSNNLNYQHRNTELINSTHIMEN